MRPSRLLPVAALLLAAAPASGATPRYSLIDIGVLPGRTGSSSLHINAVGQVTGYSFSGTGQSGNGFRWTPGVAGGPATLEDLATLAGGDQSIGLDIDDAGEVAGDSNTNHAAPRGVLWQGTAPVELFLGNGNANIHACGINNHGLLCGYMTGSGSGNPDKFRAVLWNEDLAHPGRYITTVLGILPGGDTLQSFGVASGINDAGQVVGWSFLADGTGNHAVIWDSDPAHTLIDLPQPAGAGGVIANGINQAGEVAGYQFISGAMDRAVLWGPGPARTPVDLGTLPGRNASGATGLNDRGEVVGTSYVFDPALGGTGAHGFVWQGATMSDLNDLLDASGAGWVVTDAAAVNDSGWIAATAVDASGAQRAVVLVPAPPVLAVGDGPARGALAVATWPNPARAGVDVRFALARGGPAKVEVFDVRGRRIAALGDADFGAGVHELRWDGRDASGGRAAPGLYLVKVASGEVVARAKVVLER